MTVTDITGSGPWTLTVTRAVNGTTVAAHDVWQARVQGRRADTIVQVTKPAAARRLRSVTRSRSTTRRCSSAPSPTVATNLWNLTVTRAYERHAIGAHTTGRQGRLQGHVPGPDDRVTNTGGISAVRAATRSRSRTSR